MSSGTDEKSPPGGAGRGWGVGNLFLLAGVIPFYARDIVPTSAKGWLTWACYVLEAQARPFSPRYDGIPRTDPRMRDSRETALSVRILFERAAAGGNGAGELVRDYLLDEQSWYSYSETERYHMEKLIRKFRQGLVAAGFIEGEG